MTGRIKTKNVIFWDSGELIVWQGIRKLSENNYVMAGTTISNDEKAFVYLGPLDGSSRSIYTFLYPLSTSTSLYGPEYIGSGIYKFVGSYRNDTETIFGFFYIGGVKDFDQSFRFKTIETERKVTFCHSVFGNYIVGNSAFSQSQVDSGKVNDTYAFIYNIKKDKLTFFKYPGSRLTTVYGICKNKDNTYTLCGGFSGDYIPLELIYGTFIKPIGTAYLVDFDPCRHTQLYNWRAYSYPKPNHITHFQGISTDSHYKYKLVADSLDANNSLIGSYVYIKRNNDVKWVTVKYPAENSRNSCNSIAGDGIVGVNLKIVDTSTPVVTSFQSKVIN